MNAIEIATVATGTRVQYEDMANPLRVGVVFEIDQTPWGTQYAVRFDGGNVREWDAERVTTTDLRQRGWKFERVFA